MGAPKSLGMYLLVQVLAVTTAAASVVSPPKFPARFTANVNSSSSWYNQGCDGLPLIRLGKVFQDEKSALWSHSLGIPDGVHDHLKEVLFTVPASSADPDTPEATQLTRFSWNSDTESLENCEYRIYSDNNIVNGHQFFGYQVSVLEKREVIGNVECEKWSNNAIPLKEYYWAVWFPVNAQPPYSIVAKATYITPDSPPHSFPGHGCQLNHIFKNFSTDPIAPELFAPPKQWLAKCIDSDGGIKKENIPGRQDGYVCVSPGKNNHISIALLTKPQHNVTVRIEPCSSGDSCIDGAHCKDCVKLSKPTLTFGPSNWSVLQTVEVTYLADGDTQFKITSPNYFISNGFNVQFSTCACASGKCSNDCQMFCG